MVRLPRSLGSVLILRAANIWIKRGLSSQRSRARGRYRKNGIFCCRYILIPDISLIGPYRGIGGNQLNIAAFFDQCRSQCIVMHAAAAEHSRCTRCQVGYFHEYEFNGVGGAVRVVRSANPAFYRGQEPSFLGDWRQTVLDQVPCHGAGESQSVQQLPGGRLNELTDSFF